MARRKIRDQENKKIVVGFWDMANFFTGSGSNIPPWWASEGSKNGEGGGNDMVKTKRYESIIFVKSTPRSVLRRWYQEINGHDIKNRFVEEAGQVSCEKSTKQLERARVEQNLDKCRRHATDFVW